jgi:hypothetical protein
MAIGTNKSIAPTIIVGADCLSPTAATTLTGGTTTPTLLFTAPAEGSRITKLEFTFTGSATAGKGIFFTSNDGGSSFQQLRNKSYSTFTESATADTPLITIADVTDTTPIFLKGNERVYFGSAVAIAAALKARIEGGSYAA